MKIAYVYLSKFVEKDANINQMLNMISSMAKLASITLVSCWVSRKDYDETLDFFSVPNNFGLVRLPVTLVTANFTLEKLTRLIYCLFALCYVRIKRYDVIYTRDFSFLLLVSYLPAFLRPSQKIVYEAHTIYHISSAQKVNYKLEKRAVALADIILPISQGVFDDLVELFNIDPSHMAIMEDGVNLENFCRDDEPDKLDAQGVIYSGSFIDWKGVDILVRAIKHTSNIRHVEIIGGVTPELEQIRQLARAEGVEHKLSIEGRLPQRQLIPRMLACGIGVLPNNRTPIGEKYTSPLKLFEYMACGMAIVSSDLPAMRCVLTEEENALFFRPSDPGHLAQQLDRLLADEPLRRKLQKNNLAAASEYSWDNRARKTLALLSQAPADSG